MEQMKNMDKYELEYFEELKNEEDILSEYDILKIRKFSKKKNSKIYKLLFSIYFVQLRLSIA